jgi:NTE family protein
MRAAPPDALVLGGGGILGEAWLSAVLAGIEQGGGFDPRACGGYVGTSAGSIVATALLAGERPAERFGRLPEQPPVAESDVAEEPTTVRRAFGTAASLGGAALAPFAPLALSSTAPGGAVLRRSALARVRTGRRSLAELGRMVERFGLHWDGRLRIAAVELESGRRVMFGAPGAPQLSVSEAVQASCAIPGVFRPLRAGGRSFVDGGVWSPTNMDAADVGRGDRVLCLNPTGSTRAAIRELAGALAAVSRSLAAAEALACKRRGASTRTVNPDQASVAAMGTNLMDPSRRREVIGAGVRQGRRLAQELLEGQDWRADAP